MNVPRPPRVGAGKRSARCPQGRKRPHPTRAHAARDIVSERIGRRLPSFDGGVLAFDEAYDGFDRLEIFRDDIVIRDLNRQFLFEKREELLNA